MRLLALGFWVGWAIMDAIKRRQRKIGPTVWFGPADEEAQAALRVAVNVGWRPQG